MQNLVWHIEIQCFPIINKAKAISKWKSKRKNEKMKKYVLEWINTRTVGKTDRIIELPLVFWPSLLKASASTDLGSECLPKCSTGLMKMRKRLVTWNVLY